MKIRYSLTACLLVTSVFACFSSWVASRTTTVAAEVWQISLPLGVEEPFDLEVFYRALLSRMRSTRVSRFDASEIPLDELRETVHVELREQKDATILIVSVVDKLYRSNKLQCAEILDAAIAELKSQLPASIKCHCLNRMCLD